MLRDYIDLKDTANLYLNYIKKDNSQIDFKLEKVEINHRLSKGCSMLKIEGPEASSKLKGESSKGLWV